MTNSNRKKQKHYCPPSTNKDFPLRPASNGCWNKKINGKVRYVGK